MSQTLVAVSWLYNISSTKICETWSSISDLSAAIASPIYSEKLGEHHILSFGALTSNSANVL